MPRLENVNASPTTNPCGTSVVHGDALRGFTSGMPWLACTTFPGIWLIVAAGSRFVSNTGAPAAKECAEAVTTVAYPCATRVVVNVL